MKKLNQIEAEYKELTARENARHIERVIKLERDYYRKRDRILDRVQYNMNNNS